MNESSAAKESAITDEVVIIVQYHGREYKTTQRATLAAIMLDGDTMLRIAQHGALRCMEEALEVYKKVGPA